MPEQKEAGSAPEEPEHPGSENEVASQTDPVEEQFQQDDTFYSQLSKVRRLGIQGARNTGKSCFLACLYGKPTADNAAVVFSDDKTIDGLKSIWQVLKQGKKPGATAVTSPSELNFKLESEGVLWNISTKDYAGRLVERKGKKGSEEIMEEVRTWLTGSDALLVFIGHDTDADESENRYDEIGLLLDAIINLNPDSNSVTKPLALLLTKWDQKGEIKGTPEEEETKAKEYLHSEPAFASIVNVLEQMGDQVKIFPVSAFGTNREGELPPAEGPQPFNLHRPLVWAAEATDQMLVEHVQREVNAHVGKHRWWNKYRPAIKGYRALVRDAAINKGPHFDQIQSQSKPLKRRLLWRQLKTGTLAILLVLATTFAVLERFDTRELSIVRAALEDPDSKPIHVLQTCNAYIDGKNPVRTWLKRRPSIRQELKEFKKARANSDFSALEDFFDEHPESKDAEELKTRCGTFLHEWPSSQNVVTVQAWRDVADTRAKNFAVLNRIKDAVRKLQQSLRSIEVIEDRIALLDDFVTKHPKEGLPRLAKEELELVDDQLRGEKSRLDDAAWNEVKIFIRDNPHSYDEQVDKIEDYLIGDAPRHKSEAVVEDKKVRIIWDLKEYAKVRDATDPSKIKTPAGIKKVSTLAKDYLNSRKSRLTADYLNERSTRDAYVHVKKWLNWFEKITKPNGSFKIELVKIIIAENSPLDEKILEAYVYLKVGNSKKISTVQFSRRVHHPKDKWVDFRPSNGLLDSTARINLVAIEQDRGPFAGFDGDDETSRAFPVTNLIFSDESIVPFNIGKDVTVKLRCNFARPPRLIEINR